MKFDIEKISTYKGHKDSIYYIGAGQNQDTFMSASGDGHVVEWANPEEGKPLAKVQNPIYAMAFLPEIKKLVIGENSQGIRIVDLNDKKEEAFLKIGKASLFAVVPYQNLTFIGTSMGYVHIIDHEKNKFIHHIQGASQSARSIAINPNLGEFAVGFSDHKIRIYDLKSFTLKYTLDAHNNSVFSLLYHQDMLVSTGRDAHIKLWEANLSYILATSIPAHNYAINNLILLDGTPFLASCSLDKSIKIWNMSSMDLLKVIDKGKFASHGTSVNKLWWNHHSQRLYSGSDDRTISEWKIF